MEKESWLPDPEMAHEVYIGPLRCNLMERREFAALNLSHGWRPPSVSPPFKVPVS
jgi:hypothetical protein